MACPRRWKTLVRAIRIFEETNPMCVICLVTTIRGGVIHQYNSTIFKSLSRSFVEKIVHFGEVPRKNFTTRDVIRDLDTLDFLSNPCFRNIARDPFFSFSLDGFSTIVFILMPFHDDSYEFIFLKTRNIQHEMGYLGTIASTMRRKWYHMGTLHPTPFPKKSDMSRAAEPGLLERSGHLITDKETAETFFPKRFDFNLDDFFDSDSDDEEEGKDIENNGERVKISLTKIEVEEVIDN